jgi:hypothetical protein
MINTKVLYAGSGGGIILAENDLLQLMKQDVGRVAADLVISGSIVNTVAKGRGNEVRVVKRAFVGN